MTKKKKPYFPNNWKAYQESPAEWFQPMPYEQFYSWKIDGWELPSSVQCIIREETKSGEIKEYVYTRAKDAQKRIQRLMDDESKFIVADQDQIHFLEPKQILEDYDDPLA